MVPDYRGHNRWYEYQGGKRKQVMSESDIRWEFRVLERTGVPLHKIPVVRDWPSDGMHIMCKRGRQYVVGVGPTTTKDGEEHYRQFELVDLS